MFYNQFNNSNCCNNHEEKDNKVKGYCTVKVIQECSYPSYFDLNEKEDKCDKYEDKKEKYCCNKKDNWEDKCKQKEDTCRNERRHCSFCGCFRRW